MKRINKPNSFGAEAWVHCLAVKEHSRRFGLVEEWDAITSIAVGPEIRAFLCTSFLSANEEKT